MIPSLSQAVVYRFEQYIKQHLPKQREDSRFALSLRILSSQFLMVPPALP